MGFLISKPKGKKAPLKVHQFNLFIDDQGILRCKSRLANASITDAAKQPILLPSNSFFSELVSREAHSRVFHNGVRETLNYLRQKYWILRGRELVKKQVRKCIVCRKLEGLPFKFNITPELPKERVEDCAPFSYVGVDFAGPLIVKELPGKPERKCYICLFTCATTRAVHLELVEALDINSFIRAYRRFTARRGLPATIFSDNAKTFKAMSVEVRKLLKCPKLNQFLSSKGVQWKFIAERSPWQGGIWERMVRSVKRCLVKVVGRAMLSYFELVTILVEIEGVINARPLTYVLDDIDGVSYPLTPSHLINGRNLLQSPSHRHCEIISSYETLSKRAKYHQNLLSEFSNRWKQEYLSGLMEAYKSKQDTNQPLLSVGDVVLLVDDQKKRSFWKTCKVTELIPGKDGNIRIAKVKVPTEGGNKVFTRSIKHLIPLEVSSRQSTDEQASATPAPKVKDNPCVVVDNSISARPRRNAATVGEAFRRINNLY